jgi:hypothetical protein
VEKFVDRGVDVFTRYKLHRFLNGHNRLLKIGLTLLIEGVLTLARLPARAVPFETPCVD